MTPTTVMVTTTWKPLKRSRPSVPHGTNFILIVVFFWCMVILRCSKFSYGHLTCKNLLCRRQRFAVGRCRLTWTNYRTDRLFSDWKFLLVQCTYSCWVARAWCCSSISRTCFHLLLTGTCWPNCDISAALTVSKSCRLWPTSGISVVC